MKRLLVTLFLVSMFFACDDLWSNGELDIEFTNATNGNILMLYPCDAKQDDKWPLFSQCTKTMSAGETKEISILYFDRRIEFCFVYNENGQYLVEKRSVATSNAEEGYEIGY